MANFDADLWRWANVLLSGAAVVVLVATAVYRYDHLSGWEKRVLPWLGTVLLVIAYGSGEAATQDAQPTGYRVILMPLAMLGLLGAMLFSLRDMRDHQTFIDEGSDS